MLYFLEKGKGHAIAVKKDFALSTATIYIVTIFFSVIIYVKLYGIKTLNPTYIDWLLYEGGDMTQHYLGWVAFRNSAWHFPPGMMDTLTYPHMTSVIFTDSIPLMAVLFKCISPILPENFQYFGWWGLMCLVLQGIFTARIMRNFIDGKISVVLISVLFLFTPSMLFRMDKHMALAGQWIILLGLELIFVYERYRDNRKLYLAVALMGLLSSSTHIYFTLMNGIILVGICLVDILMKRQYKRSILLLGEYLCVSATVVWLLGGLTGSNQLQGEGLGMYSLNLNALFNPMGYSNIYQELPLINGGQQEGFTWLGAGFLFLLPFSIILFLDCGRIKRIITAHREKIISLCVVAGIAMVLAISPTITMGEKKLFEIEISSQIENVWAIFRCCGRIAWIVVYIVMLCSCIMLSKISGSKRLVIVMVFTSLLQAYDSFGFIERAGNKVSSFTEDDLSLVCKEFWDRISEDDKIEHVVYCSDIKREKIYAVARWALESDKTLNTFYFAREQNTVDEMIIESLNYPAANELFLFDEKDVLLCLDYDLAFYAFDGLIAGYCEEIEEAEALAENYRWYLYENRNEEIERFVGRLYEAAEGRTMDDQTIGDWYGKLLRREESLESMAEKILYSSKSMVYNYSNKDFVQFMYGIFLEREAGRNEVSNWMRTLNQVKDQKWLIQQFARSEEFRMRMKEYGVPRSLITQ